MKFHLIGDDDAPSFFQVNLTTGLITVKNNLTTENVDFYKVSLLNLDFIPKKMSYRNVPSEVLAYPQYAWHIHDSQLSTSFHLSIVIYLPCVV